MDHLSYTNRRWLIDPDDAALPVQSGQELVERLAQERGVQFSTGAGAFELSPPEVFPEMRQAVERIHTAMEQRQHIVIFGDYDCDGITAAAQLARYFRRHDARHTVRLPHRVHDGYGVQPALVEELITKNVDLVITVDTGITAAPEIAALCDAGIDVIVTDHHAPGTTLPKATAVLHPDLAPDLATPAPSGSGVAHALLRALEGAPWQGMHVDRILAMLGTVADMVPLTGENRILVQRGLLACRDLTPGEPLHDLLLQADVDPARASSTDIAFRIAPRINAAGRMDCPTVALEALLDGGTAVENLHALNRSRQLATEDALAAAMAEYADGDTPPLLASLNAEYEHGIIGLIAGRLTEAFGKPSMVATYDDGLCTASLRSPAEYHITEALARHSELLERFGGHAQAAGCTVSAANWPLLCTRLAHDIAERLDSTHLIPTLTADALIDETSLTLAFCEQLSRLEPFGQGNNEPLFLLRDVHLQDIRPIGRDGAHLKARLGHTDVIGFRFGDYANAWDVPLDLLCRLSIHTWQGRSRVQLQIEDARLAQQTPVLTSATQTGAKAPSI